MGKGVTNVQGKTYLVLFSVDFDGCSMSEEEVMADDVRLAGSITAGAIRISETGTPSRCVLAGCKTIMYH